MNSSYANNSSNYYNSYASDDDSSPSDYDSHCDGIWKMSMAAFCLMFTLRILVVTYGQYEILPENCSSVSVTLVEAGYLIPQLDNGDMMALNSTVTVPCMHPLVNTVMNLNCTTAGEVYMEYLDCLPSASCIDLETSALTNYPAFVDLNVDWPSVKADAGYTAEFQCAGDVVASATCTQVVNDATGDYAQWEFNGMDACFTAQEASVPEDEKDSDIVTVVQKDGDGYAVDEGLFTQFMHGGRKMLADLNILKKKAQPHLVRHGKMIKQLNKDLGSHLRDWPNWVITIMAIAVVFLVVGLLYFVFKSCCCKKKSPAQY
eukprot:50033_1